VAAEEIAGAAPRRPASAGAASAELRVEAVTKTYGAVAALRGVSLEVGAGELLTILGPSGSGKTTLLKVVAGFELPAEGSVVLAGRDITEIPPARRNIGMVFQNYALFPHLTVERNVAFPLEMRGVRRAEARERVAAALAMVELAGYGARLPAQLSGGQQQRVALARAIVFNPTLLLLDEPFGALDRKLREAMQLEVRRLQRRLGLTTLFITHDQEEALILSDRIAVMSAGRIRQVGRPEEIYERPENGFVADFVGESNILAGAVVAADESGVELELEGGRRIRAGRHEAARPGARLRCLVRPERIAPGTEGANRFSGRVVETVYVGTSYKYRLRTEEGLELLVAAPVRGGGGGARPGEAMRVAVAPADAHLIGGEA